MHCTSFFVNKGTLEGCFRKISTWSGKTTVSWIWTARRRDIFRSATEYSLLTALRAGLRPEEMRTGRKETVTKNGN